MVISKPITPRFSLLKVANIFQTEGFDPQYILPDEINEGSLRQVPKSGTNALM